ncbi:hypothetical protein GLYMA_20G047050v4 [Glycine max]|nr:hypothetical protein GLYMA_20G047050v4 [Glycine max]KAH1034532.1 hypothetical protein GYH30_054805 [Glycine max]
MRTKKTMKKKTKTKTTFLLTNTMTFWVRLLTRPTCSLGTVDSSGRESTSYAMKSGSSAPISLTSMSSPPSTTSALTSFSGRRYWFF